MDGIDWRTPRKEELPEWVGLLAAIEAVDLRGEVYERQDVQDEWDSVWAHPDTDALFGWDGSDLVAFGWIKRQVGNADGHQLDCWGGVHPSRRGAGIGRELLRRQVERCRDLLPDLDPALPTVVRLEVGPQQGDLARLGARFGFAEVRRFLELACPVADAPRRPAPDGLTLHPWDHDRFDQATRAAYADAFADHWGSAPRSEEEWRQWFTGHRSFRPDLTFVLTGGAGEVAAFILCCAYPQDWPTGTCEVWVQSLGTRRPWRGRGAARALLSAAFDAAAAADDPFERVILGVDSSNSTGAVALYRSLGFDDVRFVATLALPLS